MKTDNEYLKKAVRLHRENPVVDAHLDLPGEILHRISSGERNIIKNYYLGNWKRAGINLILAAIFIEDAMLPEMGLRNAMNQIAFLKEEIASTDDVMLVKNKKDLEKAVSKNKIGIILYAEGLDFIGKDKSLIRVLYDLGVRGASLTWSRNNLLGTGCCKASESVQKYGGLTSFGMEVVEELERQGMFIDVSHLNDDGFKELCIVARRPFIATHSCSREVYFHYRNLTDEQLKKLAKQGGIVGMNGCRMIVGVSEGENPILKMCEHIEHEVKIMGAEHVGYGFDFCDSYDCARFRRTETEHPDDCLGNHSGIPILTASLLVRGMDEKDVIRIIGKNFVDYFKRNLPEG
ncbi:MAG: membrane dipeptidase [Thermoflexaceae bacterium]|nr:membrane dipeptidase [Thermoflexaceae bacterium]